MADRLEMLNSDAHRSLRMRRDTGQPHPHFVPITVGEFPAAASNCPIFFAKSAETGEFFAAALFGFEPGEVLVEGAAVGTAPFRPLDLQRAGFFTSGNSIAVDLDHPRFGEGAEIALFDDVSAPTEALRKIQRILGQLTAGLDATRAFLQELVGLRLVEPIDVSLSFDDGRKLSLQGLYTVSRDRLSELDDEQVVSLFRSGHLQAALCASFSLAQVSALAARRNQRLAAPV